MKNKIVKILAVDDVEDNLLVLKALISDTFPTVNFISASSGREGLKLCRNHRPDVVLLDVIMPDINGCDLCSILKSDKSLKHIPVIMITASRTDSNCRIKALECGADAFLAKPVDESELTAQIRAMLKLKDGDDRKMNEQKRLKELVSQRTRDLEIELRQRKRAEKELKAAIVELEQLRKTELALFQELKAQTHVRRETELALMQSKKSFQNYFKYCAVGMSVTSPDKIWLEVNQSLCRMLGYTKEELSGVTWVDLTHPDDVERNLSLFTDLVEGRLDQFEIDKRFIRKDGSILYITISVVGERNPDGSLRHLLTSYVDVTSRHLAEVAILQERSLLRTLIDNLPDSIYVKDLECRKILSNKADIEYMGYQLESEIIGKTDIEILKTPEAISSYQEDQSVIKSGIPLFNMEKSSIDSKGNQHWMLNTKIPFYDENQKIQGLVGIGQDITDRKLIQEALMASEELYRNLVEKMPDGVYISTTDGKFLSVNQAMVSIFGYNSKEEMLAIDIKKELYFDAEERNRLVSSNKKGGLAVFKLKRKDGSEIWVEDRSWYHTDANGEIKYHLGILRNVNDRIKVENEWKILTRAVEQNPASIMITNSDAKIEYVNSAFTTLTQYSMEEVINRTPRIFNRGHIKDEDFVSMWETLKAGKIWKCEYQNRRKDKSVYWEDVIISSLMNSDGVISNYILIMDDISEKKKMFDDLISAKEMAEESNRLKSSFLATMNHELRTPLNHILGFSEMILAGVDPNENISYAANIQTSGQNLLAMIEGVFDLALVEQNNIQLRKQTFRLVDLFDENKANLEGLLCASAKNQQIQLHFCPDERSLLSNVTADRTKINQVLNNLFKNAVKFTQNGIIEFGYKIENESNIVFYIKDSGIGIPLEKQRIVFDFFRQGDDSFTRVYGGIGIGLTISQKIAKVLNGELKIVSEPGQGSTFSLVVPVEFQLLN
jgi:PAS domain S-box-containing protein